MLLPFLLSLELLLLTLLARALALLLLLLELPRLALERGPGLQHLVRLLGLVGLLRVDDGFAGARGLLAARGGPERERSGKEHDLE